jgi:hypothetical protein
MITEDQLKVMKVVFTMIWQSIFSIAMIVAFFIVLNKWMASTTRFELIKFGSMETLFGATIYLAFRYWFPVGKRGE